MSKVIAHRGYSGQYPENTMLAFQKAYEAGADGIELDVHLTKDGQVVICHDESIDRTSNGQGYIKDMTLAEIQEYSFHAGFPMDTGAESRSMITAPSLETYLHWVSSLPETFLTNIEIKTDVFQYKGIVPEVLKLVRKFDIIERVLISSFNPYTILEVRDMDTAIDCGFLTVNAILDAGTYCRHYRVGNYHPHHLRLSEMDVKSAHNQNVKVNAYTVNRTEDVKRMIALGVDGIITNEVEKVCSIIGSKGRR